MIQPHKLPISKACVINLKSEAFFLFETVPGEIKFVKHLGNASRLTKKCHILRNMIIAFENSKNYLDS